MHPVAPKNLNLLTIRFPLPAIASILHRISGVVLFLLIPAVLWFMQFSLTPAGFATLQMQWQNQATRLIAWVLLLPFCYHFLAGIRHLLSDVHIGNTRVGGKIGACLVLILFAVVAAGLGIMLW